MKEDKLLDKKATELTEKVKEQLKLAEKVRGAHGDISEDRLNKVLYILNKKTVKEKIIELQKNVFYRNYLDPEQLSLFQRNYTEKIAKVRSNGEADIHSIVFSGFGHFILEVDPYLTILSLGTFEWLEKHREALEDQCKLMRKRAEPYYDKLDKMAYLRSLYPESPFDLLTVVTSVGINKTYFIVKRLKPKNLGRSTMESALVKFGLRNYDKTFYQKHKKIILGIDPKLKEFSFKTVVDKYYGIDYKEGNNAPKLAKQLKAKGISPTDKELVAFGELKKLLENYFNNVSSIGNDFKLPKLFVDLEDFEIPSNVDPWAFADSCNHSTSSAGAETHLVCKEVLGLNYLKIYGIFYNKSQNTYFFKPALRAYFYKDKKGDIAHAGGYSDFRGELDHTAYDAWSAILATIFGKKIDEFGYVDGIHLENGCVYNDDEDRLRYYTNLSSYCSYAKMGTDPKIFDELNSRASSFEKEIMIKVPQSVPDGESVRKAWKELK